MANINFGWPTAGTLELTKVGVCLLSAKLDDNVFIVRDTLLHILGVVTLDLILYSEKSTKAMRGKLTIIIKDKNKISRVANDILVM